MKLKYTSKVQRHGGSRLVSIPKTIRDVFDIDKGDTIIWEYNLETQTITIRKLE